MLSDLNLLFFDLLAFSSSSSSSSSSLSESSSCRLDRLRGLDKGVKFEAELDVGFRRVEGRSNWLGAPLL